MRVVQPFMHLLKTIGVINVFYVFVFRSSFFTFLTFLCLFFHVFILKNVAKCKVRICKNSTKNTLRGCLSNAFLLILVCYVARTANYLTNLLTLRYVLKVDNLHMTQCGTQQMSANFLSNVFFTFFQRFFSFLTFFSLKFSSERLLHLCN